MGLKLGRLFKKIIKTGVPLLGGFIEGGPAGALMTGTSLLQAKAARTFAPIGAGIPSIESIIRGPPLRFVQPVVQRNGGIAVPTAAGAIAPLAMGLSRAVIGAIVRLGGALGIAVTAANISRVGLRLWRSVTALARRHPGISILAFLTGLGLAADEAAEFLFWGQARSRRRRGRGISARDIRTCRRTMRRMAAFQRDMFRAAPRRRAVGRGGLGTVIAQN